jgi:hypothetical protein
MDGYSRHWLSMAGASLILLLLWFGLPLDHSSAQQIMASPAKSGERDQHRTPCVVHGETDPNATTPAVYIICRKTESGKTARGGVGMKFLVDAHLPQRLVFQLRIAGHDALHTKDLPLQNRTYGTGRQMK